MLLLGLCFPLRCTSLLVAEYASFSYENELTLARRHWHAHLSCAHSIAGRSHETAKRSACRRKGREILMVPLEPLK